MLENNVNDDVFVCTPFLCAQGTLYVVTIIIIYSTHYYSSQQNVKFNLLEFKIRINATGCVK